MLSLTINLSSCTVYTFQLTNFNHEEQKIIKNNLNGFELINQIQAHQIPGDISHTELEITVNLVLEESSYGTNLSNQRQSS